MKRYDNGELVTKNRIEDEDWYSLYQPFLEFVMGQIFSNKSIDVDGIYIGAIQFFKDIFEEDLSEENKSRILRWSVLHVERSSYMPKIDE